MKMRAYDDVSGNKGLVRVGALLALLIIVALLAYAFIGCAESQAQPAQYAAERRACVELYDAADTARKCMRQVDERYGQDAGLE